MNSPHAYLHPFRPCQRGTLKSLKSGRRSRKALTILELLVTMGIIGVLVALVLPAVASARESARRIQCVSQLRQLGVALHNYHGQFLCFPAGWQWEAQHHSAYGWGVPLLMFVDQMTLYHQIQRDLRIEDPANEISRQAALPLFLCPSDITVPRFTLFEDDEAGATGVVGFETMNPLVELPVANYVGVFGTLEPDELPTPSGDGAFIEARPIRMADFTRGLSSTFAVGERTMARVPSTWLGFDIRGEDAACRLVGNTQTAPNCRVCDECEFDSRHPGGANFLWGDGHVSLISENIHAAEYQLFARRSGDPF